MTEGRDRSNPISCEMIIQAKENMIARRETHLDQLADKLREERVRDSNWVNSVAFSPNGSILASGSNDGTIRLWQAA